MRFVAAPFKHLRRYLRILLRTSIIELRGIYAGSVLGLVWVVIGPLVLLVLYAVMFGVVFRTKPPDMSLGQYLVYMFSGLIPLLAFSASLMTGATALTKNRQVLLNTVFPSELLPARSVLVSSAIMPVGLTILVIADAFVTRANWSLLLVPLVIGLQLMFSCGIAWILSLITLALRDTAMILQYVSMALLFISPIGFTPEAAPAPVKILMYANPVFYYVNSFQALVAFDRLPEIEVMVVSTMLSLGSFCVGFWLFQRAKQMFMDYA